MPKKKETRGGWNKKYTTEAQRKKAAAQSHAESQKRTRKMFSISFSRTSDADIIEFLDSQPTMNGAIKKALRFYMQSLNSDPTKSNR